LSQLKIVLYSDYSKCTIAPSLIALGSHLPCPHGLRRACTSSSHKLVSSYLDSFPSVSPGVAKAFKLMRGVITVCNQEHEGELIRARVVHPKQKMGVAETGAPSAISRVLSKVYEIRISKFARKRRRTVIGHDAAHVKAAAQSNKICAALQQHAFCQQHWRIECLRTH